MLSDRTGRQPLTAYLYFKEDIWKHSERERDRGRKRRGGIVDVFGLDGGSSLWKLAGWYLRVTGQTSAQSHTELLNRKLDWTLVFALKPTNKPLKAQRERTERFQFWSPKADSLWFAQTHSTKRWIPKQEMWRQLTPAKWKTVILNYTAGYHSLGSHCQFSTKRQSKYFKSPQNSMWICVLAFHSTPCSIN